MTFAISCIICFKQQKLVELFYPHKFYIIITNNLPTAVCCNNCNVVSKIVFKAEVFKLYLVSIDNSNGGKTKDKVSVHYQSTLNNVSWSSNIYLREIQSGFK